MTGSEHSPWKPPHAGGRPRYSGPAAPQEPPPPRRVRPGPWRAPDQARPGPWAAPTDGPSGGPAAGAPPPRTGPLRTNVLGAISLVLAPIGTGLSLRIEIFPLGWLTLAIALILGVIALFIPERQRGLAIAGLIASGLGMVVAAVVALIYVFATVFGLYQFTS